MKSLALNRNTGLRRRLARLNHILIPDRAKDRDRLRQKRWLKPLGLIAVLFTGFSREGRILCSVTFAVGLASLDVRFSQVYQLFALLAALLSGSWLVRPLFRTSQLRTRVFVPPRVAAGSTLKFQVEVFNPGPEPLNNLELVVPFLPWDGRWRGSPGGVPFLEPGGRATVSVQATFSARGEHQLDRFQLAQVVPLGLALGRPVPAQGAKFLVVPRVANVTRLTTEPTQPDGQGTIARSVQSGEHDFAGVRPYRVGDPLKSLHARTWARTGVPHVREFVDERDLRLAVVLQLDLDPAEPIAGEAALSLAAGVAARLTLHGEGLDTLVCGGAHITISPRSGTAALDQVLDHLASLDIEDDGASSPVPAEQTLQSATSAVLITTGDPQRHVEMVERLSTFDSRLRWAAVFDGKPSAQPGANGQTVEAATIEAGEPIEL